MNRESLARGVRRGGERKRRKDADDEGMGMEIEKEQACVRYFEISSELLFRYSRKICSSLLFRYFLKKVAANFSLLLKK